MPDFRANWQPSNYCDPDEPGIAAHYTFPPGELGHFGYPKNRHALYGPTYDLTTRTGNPLVGQKYGVRVNNTTTSRWDGAAIVVPAIGVVLDPEYEVDAGGNRLLYSNGGRHRAGTFGAGGIFYWSTDNGATYALTAYSLSGRGRFHAWGDHDGTNARLYINGRLARATAMPFLVPAGGTFSIGHHGTIRRVVIPTAWLLTPRQRYVREFATPIIWQWEPRDVGAGPVGGIATGATGRGGWRCLLGSANLKFVTRYEADGRPYLAIYTTAVGAMERIEFDIRRPAFGSWLVEYEPASIAAGGSAFHWGMYAVPAADFTAAASQSYRLLGQTVGAVWRLTLHRENGAALLTVDAPLPTVGPPYRMRALLTRHPSGDYRLWSYVGGAWYGSEVVVANDVRYLPHSRVAISPQNVYVRRMTHFQGEMTPDELPAS